MSYVTYKPVRPQACGGALRGAGEVCTSSRQAHRALADPPGQLGRRPPPLPPSLPPLNLPCCPAQVADGDSCTLHPGKLSLVLAVCGVGAVGWGSRCSRATAATPTTGGPAAAGTYSACLEMLTLTQVNEFCERLAYYGEGGPGSWGETVLEGSGTHHQRDAAQGRQLTPPASSV